MVEPFPWVALPRVDRRSSRLLGALDLRLRMRGIELRPVPGTIQVSGAVDFGIGGVRVEAAAVLAGAALDERLADPTAGVARIRVGGVRGFVVVPGTVTRRIAQRVLGGADELAAPRPLTIAEQAVLVATVAAVLEVAGVDAEVEGTQLGGPQVPGIMERSAVVLDVRTDGAIVGSAAIVLPTDVGFPPTRLAEGGWPGWADAELAVPVIIARAGVDRASLAELRVRDVLVVRLVGQRGEGDLVVARGAIRAGLAPGSGRVTVLTAYQRRPMDETLADDATVDLAVAIGDLQLSMRALLELRPGQVLELGKPIGSAVELRLGTRVVARGELVDVDGEVGVRVLSLDRPL